MNSKDISPDKVIALRSLEYYLAFRSAVGCGTTTLALEDDGNWTVHWRSPSSDRVPLGQWKKTIPAVDMLLISSELVESIGEADAEQVKEDWRALAKIAIATD
jgi:hypothetical protein